MAVVQDLKHFGFLGCVDFETLLKYGRIMQNWCPELYALLTTDKLIESCPAGNESWEGLEVSECNSINQSCRCVPNRIESWVMGMKLKNIESTCNTYTDTPTSFALLNFGQHIYQQQSSSKIINWRPASSIFICEQSNSYIFSSMHLRFVSDYH